MILEPQDVVDARIESLHGRAFVIRPVKAWARSRRGNEDSVVGLQGDPDDAPKRPRLSRGHRIALVPARAGIPIRGRGASVLQALPILLVAREGQVSLLSCAGADAQDIAFLRVDDGVDASSFIIRLRKPRVVRDGCPR